MSHNHQPLIEDIRLLGRILGDVIREQEGTETFELVEKIRTLSVPYIDPLNLLQVELLRRFRNSDQGDQVQRGIHISINGVAAGLRNTG